MNEVADKAKRVQQLRQDIDTTLKEIKLRVTSPEILEEALVPFIGKGRGLGLGLSAVAVSAGTLWLFNRLKPRRKPKRTSLPKPNNITTGERLT